MKLQNKIKLESFLLMILPFAVYAQDLSEYKIVADYSLQTTAKDLSGNYDDITLENAPYQDTNGVYSNGKYIFSGEDDGCLIETPSIKEVNSGDFALSVEFKPELKEKGSNPIIVMGRSWRSLGFEIQNKNKFTAIFNGYHLIQDSVEITEKWQEITVVYTQEDSTAKWYLDNKLLYERTGHLIYDTTDTGFSNTHFGGNGTYKGYLRNMKVYSNSELTAQKEYHEWGDDIKVIGNPVQDGILKIQNKNAIPYSYALLDYSGQLMCSGSAHGEFHSVHLKNYHSGIYFLKISDFVGKFKTTKKIILMK